jgi:hypothetical protein
MDIFAFADDRFRYATGSGFPIHRGNVDRPLGIAQVEPIDDHSRRNNSDCLRTRKENSGDEVVPQRWISLITCRESV